MSQSSPVTFASATRPDLGALSGSALLDYLPTDGLAWLHRERGLVAWGTGWRHDPGSGEGRFLRAALALHDAFASWDGQSTPPIALAAFTFDPDTPGSFVRIPRHTLRTDGHVAELINAYLPDVADTDDMKKMAPADQPLIATALPAQATADRVRYAGASVPDLLWLDAVSAATRLIDKGEVRKVVLARDHAVWSKAPFDARVLARRLTQRFPQCFTFIAEGLVGASPELLVRRQGSHIESLILAGTAARGNDQSSDAVFADTLMTSDKERDEHAFAVASVRESLHDRCSELIIDPEPSLLRLDNVQHLATRVVGTLAADSRGLIPTALEVAGALHPTAAVCGTPTHEALQVIRALEGMDRGRYTGPVGWVDANGDGEFAIALRCAELSGARARLFAGGGIVAASLPEAELEETRIKLHAMQQAIDPDGTT